MLTVGSGMEDTPDVRPDLFGPVRGRRGRRHRATGEIWQLDLLHADHREAYQTLEDFGEARAIDRFGLTAASRKDSDGVFGARAQDKA